MLKSLQGETKGANLRLAIVASRFHDYLVDKLIAGAQETLLTHGVQQSGIDLVKVPGSFELPFTCKELAASKSYDALVALGVLIKGDTLNFDLICSAMISGLNQVSLEFRVPIGFGVITAQTLEQAVERAGGKLANRGVEAALAALEMANLKRMLQK